MKQGSTSNIKVWEVVVLGHRSSEEGGGPGEEQEAAAAAVAEGRVGAVARSSIMQGRDVPRNE